MKVFSRRRPCGRTACRHLIMGLILPGLFLLQACSTPLEELGLAKSESDKVAALERAFENLTKHPVGEEDRDGYVQLFFEANRVLEELQPGMVEEDSDLPEQMRLIWDSYAIESEKDADPPDQETLSFAKDVRGLVLAALGGVPLISGPLQLIEIESGLATLPFRQANDGLERMRDIAFLRSLARSAPPWREHESLGPAGRLFLARNWASFDSKGELSKAASRGFDLNTLAAEAPVVERQSLDFFAAAFVSLARMPGSGPESSDVVPGLQAFSIRQGELSQEVRLALERLSAFHEPEAYIERHASGGQSPNWPHRLRNLLHAEARLEQGALEPVSLAVADFGAAFVEAEQGDVIADLALLMAARRDRDVRALWSQRSNSSSRHKAVIDLVLIGATKSTLSGRTPLSVLGGIPQIGDDLQALFDREAGALPSDLQVLLFHTVAPPISTAMPGATRGSLEGYFNSLQGRPIADLPAFWSAYARALAGSGMDWSASTDGIVAGSLRQDAKTTLNTFRDLDNPLNPQALFDALMEPLGEVLISAEGDRQVELLRITTALLGPLHGTLNRKSARRFTSLMKNLIEKAEDPDQALRIARLGLQLTDWREQESGHIRGVLLRRLGLPGN